MTLSANVCRCAGVTPSRKIGKVSLSVENDQPPKDMIRFTPVNALNSSNICSRPLMSTSKLAVIPPKAKCYGFLRQLRPADKRTILTMWV